MPAPRERLDKILTSQGIAASRSLAGRLIRGGGVTVDGAAVRDPALKVDAEAAAIAVGGREIAYRRQVYLMMNKPAGVLCVSRDKKAETVVQLLPGEFSRPGLFPAGRLDKDTTGLVIITDDGDFAHRMLAPRHEIFKTYHAVLDAPVGDEDIAAFAGGIVLEDGTACRPASLRVLEPGARPTVEIRISEGRYHQIKRMAAAREKQVLSLKRTAVGRLILDDRLPEGGSREITTQEQLSIFEKV